MEITVIATPQTPRKVMTPEELAEGRNTVIVLLGRDITLLIEGCTVTYPAGEHQAPAVIANILFEQGAERVGPDGCFIKRESAAKPVQMRYANPFGGSIRYTI